VHLDFAEKDGKNFLVLTDAYSKWFDVIVMSNITSATLIEVLRPIMAAHGFPELIVTDNGPSFASAEFKQFCSRNGINQQFTPPYHPASNGAAERGVQTLSRPYVQVNRAV
jgi:transposase InsO family protein